MKLIDRLISSVAPALCLSCGAEGNIVCSWCFPDFLAIEAERCIGCNALSDESRTCQSCRQKTSLPKHVWVRTTYEGGGKALLSSLKFLRAYSAHERIAELMDESLPYLAKDTIITHIPTSPSRVRSRGYDQSRLLARSLAHQRGLSHTTMLTRLTNTRQVGASRLERRKQLNNAYHVNSYRSITNKSPILLVDDIYTTGGTLSAATAALKKEGYKNISAIIFARAL